MNAGGGSTVVSGRAGKVMEPLDLPGLPEGFEPTTAFDSVKALNSRNQDLRDIPFSMGEVLENMRAVRSLPRSYVAKMKKIRDDTAEYREKYILPNIEEIEKRVARDPDYFPYDVVREGTRYRFPTLIIPEGFGGPGYLCAHIAIMSEELAVGSGGFATTIAVNMAQLVTLFDPYLFAVYARESLKAEKRGEVIVWSGGVTEPDAGTDRWDAEFQSCTRAGMVAEKVAGGYRLSGAKCFISNGSVSRRAVVSAALDVNDYAGTGGLFIVKTDTPGFSIGRIERKMGQKASQTSEQICQDAFVPDSHRVGLFGITPRFTTLYLAASRGPVGAIGVGCGRRALESLVRWAAENSDGRGRLIDRQALQIKIANMGRDLMAARAAYIQACVAFDAIACRVLSPWYTRLALRLTPMSLLTTETFRRMIQSERSRERINGFVERVFPDDMMMYMAGLAAHAKVLGSYTGRKIAGEVMEIMGPDAADPRWGVDRAYRDARLTEIYEGTNQACAITAFKAMAGSFEETMK
ncbi:MAG: acyl-CoA/acyl-ACP dehydrogenase [Actinobacteria bacterium]|nr:acyl-CoA/acyl-ACP dehydrogenase [Actinomycetota bacterium]MBU1944225.1 acyl-CoA/acyl-ACP dehydrogenase [Actinomycetota bacterium]MBU2688382.1 acyl-CoA/acyl-ACP dehydrogenase [Actinomycetota bacterium]